MFHLDRYTSNNVIFLQEFRKCPIDLGQKDRLVEVVVVVIEKLLAHTNVFRNFIDVYT